MSGVKKLLAMLYCTTVGVFALPLSLGSGQASDAVATRLVHGPVAFRLTGWEGDPDARLARYVFLYKLNQDVRAERFSVGNDSTRGNFAVEGLNFIENGPSKFGPRGCFALTVYSADGPLYNGAYDGRLERFRLGARLRVSLQPLTPGAAGEPVLGRKLFARPRLQRADYRLRGRAARRELKRIGCLGGRSPAPSV